MSLVRRATPEDAAEVLRLRQVMIDSVHAGDPSTDWHALSLPTVRARLAGPDGTFAAFVVDHPERPGTLAALAAGTLEYRIGRADNPHGRVGHVFSVATDPDVRRRGYARACVEALLDWFREIGAAHVDLNASAEAEPLYASLGFVRKPDPSMRLHLRST
ncbi:GNAT family N-acetyltransferase [Streptomyces minutiscleroticus]|uniref:N-acetyltransferase n=1 Tax=Streptomyces minutiscleroticus TaxID=68238 RepID=A0A918K902_9ACTN|nr:GNAT family N-acetyltransferase [Streptomyces minutiscleroticus]GGX52151.1 N-acetyltransferase [Streptomyces minutiscleroticus]